MSRGISWQKRKQTKPAEAGFSNHAMQPMISRAWDMAASHVTEIAKTAIAQPSSDQSETQKKNGH